MSNPAPNLNTPRLIYLAFAGGVLLFALVAVALQFGTNSPPVGGPNSGSGGAGGGGGSSTVFGWALVGIAVYLLVQALVAAPLIRKGALKQARSDWQSDADLATRETQIFTRYLTQSVVAAAMLEAAGLVGVLALFLYGQWWGLVVSAGVIAALLMSLPSGVRYEAFVNDVARADER